MCACVRVCACMPIKPANLPLPLLLHTDPVNGRLVGENGGVGASALMTEIKAEGRDKEDGLHADP